MVLIVKKLVPLPKAAPKEIPKPKPIGPTLCACGCKKPLDGPRVTIGDKFVRMECWMKTVETKGSRPPPQKRSAARSDDTPPPV